MEKKEKIRIIKGPFPYTKEDLKQLKNQDYETYYQYFEIITKLNISQ